MNAPTLEFESYSAVIRDLNPSPPARVVLLDSLLLVPVLAEDVGCYWGDNGYSSPKQPGHEPVTDGPVLVLVSNVFVRECRASDVTDHDY